MRASHIRVSNSHKKGIIIFLLITLVLVFAVLYFTLTKVVITLTPEIQQVETQFFIDVAKNDSTEDMYTVSGTIEEKIVEKKEKFKATGSKTIEPTGDSDTIGMVTLHNTLDSKIELVATTRLLTEDDILYRIQNKVTIPPGGTIDADIYADEPDEFVELDVGRLTIPGLSADLQEKVYAENTKKISKEKQVVNFVQKEDETDAIEKLKDKIKKEALNDVKLTYGDSGPVILVQTGEPVEATTDTPVGAEADEFELTLKMKIISVFLDRAETLALIDSELDKALEPGQKKGGIDFRNTFYTIEKFDLDSETANVKIQAVGHATLGEDHELLDPNKIVGSTKQQVEIYYKSFDDIKDVEVMFTPFWVKRVPKMLDHVEIIVR